jgi:hypothetical protein
VCLLLLTPLAASDYQKMAAYPIPWCTSALELRILAHHAEILAHQQRALESSSMFWSRLANFSWQ